MKVTFLDGTEREVALEPRANLRGANLGFAILRDADLRDADLRYADLRYADLRGANLGGANLGFADLRGANLGGANLSVADLGGADLRGVNLGFAILRGAILRGANLANARGLAAFCILAAGAIVGYKKLRDGSIATLLVPADAKRVNNYSSRKCRAEFVYVTKGNGATDKHTGETSYKTGTLVRPDKFDPDPRVECSNGIHFFITREEAEEY